MSTCKICACSITDEILAKTYYDPEYPLIDIGPYCATCMGKVRVCAGCHVPHQIGVDTEYFGNGNYFCSTCVSSLRDCVWCGNKVVVYKTVDGRDYCEVCFKEKFRECSRCSSIKHLNEYVTDKLERSVYKGMFKNNADVCKECFNKNKSRFKKYEVRKCLCCESIYTDGEKKSNKNYCPSCYPKLDKCHICNEKRHNLRSFSVDSSISRECSAQICTKCKSSLKTCSSCGRKSIETKRVCGKFSHKEICKECVSFSNIGECPVCLKFLPLDTTTGKCQECTYLYTDNNKCDECGRLKDHNRRCRVCYSSDVYNYTLKPRPHFWYSPTDLKTGDGLFMGIENEVTFGNSSCAKTDGLLRLYKAYDPRILLAKSDGSIRGSGYEIVLQPMTLNTFHTMDMSRMFDRSMKPSDSCGMHVHVNRESFLSDIHIFKVIEFINNNCEFANLIAGRGHNNYNCKIPKKPSAEVLSKKKGNETSRSVRVNMSNKDTIEFRLFAGCVREFELRFRLEFVHSLVTWSKVLSLSSVSVPCYISYVQKNKNLYPNLVRFLKKKAQSFLQ